MDFTKFFNAKHFLSSTGLSIEDGLKLIESELKKLERGEEEN